MIEPHPVPRPALDDRYPWRFRILCAALGLISLIAGEWLVREALLGRQVAGLEALRPDGGRYIVNEIATMGYRPEAITAVLYGDSSNDSVPERDQDKRFISQMLRDELADSGLAVAGISFPGNAVDWMSSHLRYAARRYPGLDYLVIPLNLRWISPGWRGRRATAGARRLYELRALGAYRWVLGAELAYAGPPGGMDQAVVETVVGPVEVRQAKMSRDDYMAEFGGESEAVRHHIGSLRIALSYGVTLAEDDPFFSEIDRIAETCRAEAITCLFYLPPFNLDLAREFSTLVADTLEANLRSVRAFASRRGYRLLDLSTQLSPPNFHDDYNEHVDQVGRRLIAGCIARALEALHRADDLDGRRLACRTRDDGSYAIAATALGANSSRR